MTERLNNANHYDPAFAGVNNAHPADRAEFYDDGQRVMPDDVIDPADVTETKGASTTTRLRELVIELRRDLIREFRASGAYNRTAVWAGINRVFSDEWIASLPAATGEPPDSLDVERLARAMYAAYNSHRRWIDEAVETQAEWIAAEYARLASQDPR